jgi:hypothetical protein
MYQIYGVKWLAVGYATVAAAVAILFFIIQATVVPPSVWGWPEFVWKPVSIGLSMAAAALWLLGETRIFSKICRHAWAKNILPDLDGEWVGDLSSNWPIIEGRATAGAQPPKLLSRPATVRLHVTLLSIIMTLESDNRYSNSRTILVGITKDKATGDCALTYVYENRTPNPQLTDEQMHFGAAVLTLRRDDAGLTLSGPYWTNRNWTRGQNTAGIATFRKRQGTTAA